jgi:phosphotransacetylase
MGFVDVILCGDSEKIHLIADENNIDISDFKIIHCMDDLSVASTAVSLVRTGQADILMKGLIHTADILRAVLNRETGIRGDGILSHVSVLYSPSRNRRLFLTDIAMVMYPDVEKKVGLVKNAVSFANHMGVSCPRVAPLCAVETLNPAMQATIDADALQKMNTTGKISDCIISGPISFDIAVSSDAAMAKGYNGSICGDADILLFDNIEAGNNTIKAMVQFGDWIFGGVVVGARAPIVINSRSDSDLSKLFSIACACTM